MMDVYTPPFLNNEDISNQSGLKRKYMGYDEDDNGSELSMILSRKSSHDYDDEPNLSLINNINSMDQENVYHAPPSKRMHFAVDPDAGPTKLSDHLKDMSNCQCSVCGKVFVHHRMLKHIERTHKLPAKDRFIYLRISQYRCKLCTSEMLFSFYTIGQHVRSRHQMTLQQYRDTVPGAFQGDHVIDESIDESCNSFTGEKVITDNLVEMCQVKCFICDHKMYLNSLKRHLQNYHEDYDLDFKVKIEFVKTSFYKCKMCDVVVLFHFDAINKHLSQAHNSTMHAYKNTFPAFSGDKEYKACIKAADKEKAKQMRIARQSELDPQSVTPVAKSKPTKTSIKPRGKSRSKFTMDEQEINKWSITLNKALRYYSNNQQEMCVRQCRVCSEIMLADSLKAHIYQNHRGIRENTSSMDYIRLTYHKCKACGKDLKFTSNSITKHTKRSHNVNFKEYAEQYSAFDDVPCDLNIMNQPLVETITNNKKKKPSKAKDASKSDTNKDASLTSPTQQGHNNYLTTLNTNIPKENGYTNSSYGYNSPVQVHQDRFIHNVTPTYQQQSGYPPQHHPAQVQASQQSYVQQQHGAYHLNMRLNHMGPSSPIYAPTQNQNQFNFQQASVSGHPRSSPQGGMPGNQLMMSPGACGTNQSIHPPPSNIIMSNAQFAQNRVQQFSPHFVVVQEQPLVKQEPQDPQHSMTNNIGNYAHIQAQQTQYIAQSTPRGVVVKTEPNAIPPDASQQYHYLAAGQHQQNCQVTGVKSEPGILAPLPSIRNNQYPPDQSLLNLRAESPSLGINTSYQSAYTQYDTEIVNNGIKVEPGVSTSSSPSYPGNFQLQGGVSGIIQAASGQVTVKTEPATSIAENALLYAGLKHGENLPSALSPITNQLSPIEPGIKAEPDLDGQLSPLAGLDDDAWYDGNTFQCMQCGFISRSLDNFNSHVTDYHKQSPQDFMSSVSRTSIMYRCKLCHQEVYHEKSAINNHVAFHSLDLQLYASIYEHTNDEQKSITKKVLNVSIKGDKLKPLETQVAGHGTGDKISHRGMLLHEDGFVLKPAQAPPKGTREIEFYETISKSQHPVHRKLYSLIPKFYGTERLSRDGLNPCQYLVLEDLTQGMIAPCVMDVKIGAKTYGPMATPAKIAQEDSKYLGTKKPLGFSVLGIINRSGENGSMKRYDKSFGMQLATDSVQQMLNVFFNTSSENPDIVAKLVKHFTALLEDVQQCFASQTHYHIYASSILLVYDYCVFAEKDEVRKNRVWSSGEIDKYVRLKIIDFAHVFPAHGQVDHNFIFGLDNLCNLFKRFDCAG